MGPLALALVGILHAVVTLDLILRRDYWGAVMALGSVVFTIGAFGKFYENV
jgi:hypothetical protein